MGLMLLFQPPSFLAKRCTVRAWALIFEESFEDLSIEQRSTLLNPLAPSVLDIFGLMFDRRNGISD